MRAFLLLLAVASAPIQAQVLIRVQQGNSITPVANGASVTLASTGVGAPVTAQVTLTYTGSTSITFTGGPKLLGSPDFSIVTTPQIATLGPGQSLSFEVRYLPASGLLAQTALDYAFLQAAPPPAAGQPSQPSVPGIIGISLNGTAPEYSLAYTSALDGNTVVVAAGGTLEFIDTVLNSATAVPMALANRGSGTGQLVSVATTGSAFSLASLPLLPSLIPANAVFQFQVRYQPRQTGGDSGALTLTFENGATYRIGLQGRGIVSYLSYDILSMEGGSTPVTPNQAIQLTGTPVGDSTTLLFRFSNQTTRDLTIPTIAITGTSYGLQDVPIQPVVVPPGDSQLFSIVFSPTAPGPQNGTLRIGGDVFFLTGEGIGPQLSYSYRSPAGVTPVQPLGNVVFPGAQVGGSSTVDFIIRNSGSAPAPIVSIGIVSDGARVFEIEGLQALPTSIAPSASIVFTIRFSPLNTTFATASLRVNNDAFPLGGIGATPEPLPSYTIDGPTTIQSFQQPAIGLTLASPYGMDVTGTLSLATESESGAGDPSVQFSTGGQVVNFTIPAGETKAVFPSGSNQIKFQTGSVAGTIVFTPAFVIEGGLDLTPENPLTLRLALPAAAPLLAGASVDNRTTTGFTLSIVGTTTTRSLTRAKVSFKGKPGFNFTQTEFEMDLTAASFGWFTSPSSVQFGGQFLMQVPFSFSNSDTSNQALSPILAIESVAVTVSNSLGSSNQLTALIQ
ncbi:MAG: choice-of-anchor D domain-containing protein [Bryobacteraceae bacterium]|nr:choice-of-anchor D domain-containing protein [Bryobacteraceae bacterium]